MGEDKSNDNNKMKRNGLIYDEFTDKVDDELKNEIDHQHSHHNRHLHLHHNHKNNDNPTDFTETNSMRELLPAFIQNEQKYSEMEIRIRNIQSSPLQSVKRRFSQDSCIEKPQNVSCFFFLLVFIPAFKFFQKKKNKIKNDTRNLLIGYRYIFNSFDVQASPHKVGSTITYFFTDIQVNLFSVLLLKTFVYCMHRNKSYHWQKI